MFQAPLIVVVSASLATVQKLRKASSKRLIYFAGYSHDPRVRGK
jgi:hypothetical protein